MKKQYDDNCEECIELENWCNECWLDRKKEEREANKRRAD